MKNAARRSLGGWTLLLAAVGSSALGQQELTAPSTTPNVLATTAAERVVVTSRLIPTDPEESGFDVTALDRDALESAPARRLDDLLREAVPGFSLFRRNGSRVANPTTQGVSLRNVGPSGAGRTLVLLDGIPQNDPFGGWVYWNRLPPSAIERVEVLQGGGAGLWGNAALGGTIALTGRQFSADAFSAEADGGSRETYELSAAGQKTLLADGALALSGRADRFSTGGYPTVRPDQRGRVDIPADSESTLVDLAARCDLRGAGVLTLKAGGFDETRGNGTPLTDNATRAADFSAALVGEIPGSGVGYQAQAYGQLREYEQRFSSVAPDRRSETPSLDQFSVPAQAVGGSVAAGFAPWDTTHRLLLGADSRWINGETRERFRLLDGQFTRQRAAGGEQLFVGAFAEDAWRPDPKTTLTAAGRIDYYANDAGHRRETSLPDGAATLDESFPDRDGWAYNGRLGISRQMLADTDALRLRAAAYTGFRVPTLNELYRPFRVRNDITEANPALKPERLRGADLGAEIRPSKSWTLSLGGFYNELADPVANVTLAQGPGTAPLFGFIPAGGVGRQRRNLGRAVIWGGEFKTDWTPAPEWRLSVNYLYSRATVASAPGAAALEGKRLAQAPEHQVVGSVRWTPFARWETQVQARFAGDQFEDDLNTLRLGGYVTFDASIAWNFADHWRARLSGENLFNTEYQTGKTADGLVSIGAPRLLDASLRWEY